MSFAFYNIQTCVIPPESNMLKDMKYLDITAVGTCLERQLIINIGWETEQTPMKHHCFKVFIHPYFDACSQMGAPHMGMAMAHV